MQPTNRPIASRTYTPVGSGPGYKRWVGPWPSRFNVESRRPWSVGAWWSGGGATCRVSAAGETKASGAHARQARRGVTGTASLCVSVSPGGATVVLSHSSCSLCWVPALHVRSIHQSLCRPCLYSSITALTPDNYYPNTSGPDSESVRCMCVCVCVVVPSYDNCRTK